MKRITYLICLSAFLSVGWSQTTGKLTGLVKGDDGSALVGANIIVLGTGSGASAGEAGDYTILNIPAGSYTVMASYIGYASQEISNVQVISGLSTEINFSLSTSSIEGEVVQVTAEKPLIQKDETSSVNTITSEDLLNMPIRDLDGILATMPGIVVQNDEVHIRGGRDNEVAYFLNGSSTTNLGNRENLVYVPKEAVEELQVQVGGYDAEVSGANSGVIKRSLKRGSGERISGSLSYQMDGGDAGNESFGGYSYGHSTTIATIGGPLSESLRFFAAVEGRTKEDPYVKVSEGFSFLDLYDENPNNPNVVAGNPDQFDLSWSDGYTPGSNDDFANFTGTLTYGSGPLRATLGAVANYVENRKGGGILSQLRWGGANIMTSDSSMISVDPRYVTEESGSTMLSADITYAIGSNTILDISASSYSQTSEDVDSWLGNNWQQWSDQDAVQPYVGVADSVWSPYKSRFREAQPYRVNGIEFSRPGTRAEQYNQSAYQKTGFSTSLQHVTGRHDIKFGVDYNAHTLRERVANPSIMAYTLDDSTALALYGHNGYGDFSSIPSYILREYIDGYGYDFEGGEIEERKVYSTPIDGVEEPDVSYLDGAKTPWELGVYLQDKIEYDDIVVNLGLRIDQLNPSETAPKSASELYFYEGSGYVTDGSWEEVETYTEVQPRIGISFPFTDKTNVYGYYGKFSQLVDLNSMYYTALDYANQMNGGGNFYVSPVGFGLEPVRTTQYEIGFKQQVSDNAALKVTGFYKNQKGLIQADRVSEYSGDLNSAYNYVRNGDFATTKGLEFSLLLRRISGFSANMNYTMSQAEGTGSGRSSYLAALDRGSEAPLMVNPVDFNQTHSGSINLDYRLMSQNQILNGLGSNLLFTFNSGHSFTYVYRPAGGQVDAYDAGVDYMNDTRSREALESVGASTTPWVYNLDFKLDKNISLGNYNLTLFARVNNLLDRRNALNVYQATGSADNDGYITNGVYSQGFNDLYGQDPDGDGVTDYEEMYNAININNDESYRTEVGDRLISAPRQVFIGFSFNF